MSDHLQRTKAHLAFMTGHDQLLALQLAISTFFVLPFLVLVVPFLRFALDLLVDKRLTDKQKSDLRSRFPIPKTLILRRHDTKECHVYSIPLFSILYLNKQVLKNLDSPINRGIVLHELGHHGKNDATVLSWLRHSLVCWLLVIPAHIFVVWLPLIGIRFEEVAMVTTRTFDIAFVTIAATLVPLIILAIHHRYAHRREFVADSLATSIDTDAIQSFLKFGKWKSSVSEERLLFGRKRLFANHPPFSERLQVQSNGLTTSPLKSFWFSFQWSVFAALIFAFSVSTPAPVFMPEEIHRWYLPGASLLLGFFIIFSVGVFLSRAAEIHYANHNFYVWTVLGYAAGGTLTFLIIALVNYTNHRWDSLFGLVEGLVIMSLLFPTLVLILAASAKLAARLRLPSLCTGVTAFWAFYNLNYVIAFIIYPEARGASFDYAPHIVAVIWIIGSVATLLSALALTGAQKLILWGSGTIWGFVSR